MGSGLRGAWRWIVLALVLGTLSVGAIGCSSDDSDDEGPPTIAEARKATQEDPDDPDAWRDLSLAFQIASNQPAAITAIRRYMELRPKDVRARRELAGLYFADARNRRDDPKRKSTAPASFKQAIATYVSLVPALPKDSQLRLELGQAAQEGGDVRTAVTAYKAFLRLAPKDPNAQYVREQLRKLLAAD